MGNSNTAAGVGGVGFTGLLAVAFIVLKLTGLIDWSWWWVLSPLWLPFLLVAVLLMGAGLVYLFGKGDS